MTYAPSHTSFPPHGDGSIRGCFTHAETNVFFEFSACPMDERAMGPDFDMRLWMSDGSYRYCQVLKTVAHIAVDEDANGEAVVEKWAIKKARRCAAA